MTVSSLPPNLRRQGAHTTHAREEAVLNNFEVVREIEAGLLISSASSMDYIDEARKMGFEVEPLMHDEDSKQHLYAIKDKDVIVAILHAFKGQSHLYPTENRW